MFCLMDTGASPSCIGGNAAKSFLESGQECKCMKSYVKPANGNRQNVVGLNEMKITFEVCEKDITIFIVPRLDGDLSWVSIFGT